MKKSDKPAPAGKDNTHYNGFSIISRDGDGNLMCGPKSFSAEAAKDAEVLHAEADALVERYKAAGFRTFILLGIDDSVMRHWTRPQ